MHLLRKSVFLAAALLATSTLAFAQTKEVHRTVSLDEDGRVVIDTFKGSVKVSTWNRDKVEIRATINSDTTGDDQDERVEQTEIRIYGSDRLVEIESDYSDADYHKGGLFGFLFGGGVIVLPYVHYEIKMPATAKLDIDDHKSRIEISALEGDLTLSTHKGHAKINALEGGARIETHKGDIRVEFASLSRSSSFETHKGEIEIFVPPGASFRLDGELGEDARLDSEFAMITHSFGDDERINAKVNGGDGPEIWIETHRGTIRLRKSR